MEYFTTSLLPSGNRLVTEAFCPGLMMTSPVMLEKEVANDGSSSGDAILIPRLLKQVDIQSTADALLLGNDTDVPAIQWIVGTPSSTSPDKNERHFWMVLDNGDQYRLTSSQQYDQDEDDKEVDVDLDLDESDDTSILMWDAVDSVERPLVIGSNLDSNETSSSSFEPLEQPYGTSPLSAAVPTPNGDFLLVHQLVPGDSTYQLTQFKGTPGNLTDVTHSSLRSALVQHPLPDATLAYSQKHQLWAVYTSSTTRYNHAVLGDPLEALTLTVLQWNAETESVELHSQATLEDTDNANIADADETTVFEGLGVIWADVNGDGQDDLVTTISNRQVGARLRVYTWDRKDNRNNPRQLQVLAQAPAIGLGGRWLHQLAVGNLGPRGETELVEIRTPHIGGIVRYYRYNDKDKELQLVASTERYTSHDIRSRNLDKAVVGDFNGDGIPELVVQNQAKDELVGLQRTNANTNEEGVETVWSIPLSSPIQSNLAVSCSPADDGDGGGILEILFATEDHNLVKLQFAAANVSAGALDDMIASRSPRNSGHGGSASSSWWMNQLFAWVLLGMYARRMF